jgi:PEP-CTERM motif-containing protein
MPYKRAFFESYRITLKIGFPTLAVIALRATSIEAASYTVQTIIDPVNPTFTQALGINNSGTIVGFDGSTAQGYTLTGGTFTPENYPAAAQTMLTGINGAGNTVGIYIDGAGTTHGFTDMGGTFKTVDQPGTVFNQGLGINSGNVTVGYSSAIDPAGMVGQKAYSQSGGAFTSINALLPVNFNSQAVGINNAGNIVGFYMPTSTTSIGFEDIGGAISTIDPFGSTFTQALGINNLGEIVGVYTDASGNMHGYTDLDGLFSSFDAAGPLSQTTINGVNDLGQIVGFYTDALGNVDGFVGTPTPEPTMLALLGAGSLLVGMVNRRRKG